MSGKIILDSIQFLSQKVKANDRIEKLEFTGKYSIDDQEFQDLNLCSDVNIKKNQKVVLVGHFNKKIENKEILFFIRNFQFTMKINGQCVAEYGHPGTYPSFLKSAGFTRYMYSAKSLTEDDLVEIELVYPYNRGGESGIYNFINQISVGEKADFYSVYLTDHVNSFLLVTTIMLIGLFAFIASMFLRLWKNKNGLRALSFSLVITSGGIWFMMDTFYMADNALIPFSGVTNMIDLINMLILPLCGVFFIVSFLDNSRMHRIASTVLLGQLICVTAIITLQVLGIKDIYESQIVSVPYNGISALIVIIIAFYEVIIEKNEAIKSAVIAILPTALGVYGEVFIHYWHPQKYRYLFRIGFIASCVIHFLTSISLFKDNAKTKEREQELRNKMTNLKVSIMLSQIQPHFLYNALNTIQYICLEDAKKAAKAIEHFSKYLRGNMDSLKEEDLIPFMKELNHLDNYLYLEYLRFEDRVKVEYDLQVTDFLIPCLIIQPIVENAIRYGITKKVEGGTVNIVTREDDSNIVITVSDDGVGFNPEETQYDNRSHIGIDNVRSRLKLQCNGSLKIDSRKNVGTTITIEIPKEGVMLL